MRTRVFVSRSGLFIAGMQAQVPALGLLCDLAHEYAGIAAVRCERILETIIRALPVLPFRAAVCADAQSMLRSGQEQGSAALQAKKAEIAGYLHDVISTAVNALEESFIGDCIAVLAGLFHSQGSQSVVHA